MTTVTSSTEASLTNSVQSNVSSESLISSDFDTWLNLMTAQLQNQDPFDPVDSTAYTAQLAQFSAVEQQVQTNDLLSELISVSTSSDMASMAEWVGKEVRVAAEAEFNGDPVSVMAITDDVASSAQLVVRDQYGAEINRFAAGIGETEINWNGTNSSGQTVSYGTYSFEVESYDSYGELIGVNDAEIYTEVLEVQRVGDQYALILPGGTAVGTASVSAIRPLS